MATKKQQPAETPENVVDDGNTIVVGDVVVLESEPEPEPEPEVFDALVSGRLIETPVDPGPPPMFGFEEEPPKESNILLDEPDPVPPSDAPIEVVGTFVGYGAEQVTRADGEWLVDPATGCITGPVD